MKNLITLVLVFFVLTGYSQNGIGRPVKNANCKGLKGQISKLVEKEAEKDGIYPVTDASGKTYSVEVIFLHPADKIIFVDGQYATHNRNWIQVPGGIIWRFVGTTTWVLTECCNDIRDVDFYEEPDSGLTLGKTNNDFQLESYNEPQVIYQDRVIEKEVVVDCSQSQEFKDWKEWVYAYQNHKNIYVDGQIVRQKYRFLERQYEFLRKTDCGALYVMPNRNSDGKVVVAGLIGFGAGVLVGKEFSKEKVVYRNNPITQPNPTRPTTTADNPPVGPIPGNKTISGRNTTRVVLAGRNPISVRKKG